MLKLPQISKLIGVSASTLYSWQKNRPAYCNALELASISLDIDKLHRFVATEQNVALLANQYGLDNPLTDRQFIVPATTLRDWIKTEKKSALIYMMITGYSAQRAAKLPVDIANRLPDLAKLLECDESELISLIEFKPQLVMSLIRLTN